MIIIIIVAGSQTSTVSWKSSVILTGVTILCSGMRLVSEAGFRGWFLQIDEDVETAEYMPEEELKHTAG